MPMAEYRAKLGQAAWARIAEETPRDREWDEAVPK